jgi:hypothetical protein
VSSEIARDRINGFARPVLPGGSSRGTSPTSG